MPHLLRDIDAAAMLCLPDNAMGRATSTDGTEVLWTRVGPDHVHVTDTTLSEDDVAEQMSGFAMVRLVQPDSGQYLVTHREDPDFTSTLSQMIAGAGEGDMIGTDKTSEHGFRLAVRRDGRWLSTTGTPQVERAELVGRTSLLADQQRFLDPEDAVKAMVARGKESGMALQCSAFVFAPTS